MSVQDDLSDARATIRDLVRRIEILERHSPLENASITSGTLRIATPEGIRVKDGGTVTVESDAGIDVKESGSVKAGAAELSGKFGGHVKSGGTSIGSDGIIRNDGGKVGFGHPVEVTGGVKASGQIDPGSVLATWNGARHTIEQITGWLQGDINSVSGRTTTAQNRADAAHSLATTANGTANAAKTATDNHGPRITSLETTRATITKVNQVIDKLNALEDQVQSFHPTKPYNPPLVKD